MRRLMIRIHNEETTVEGELMGLYYTGADYYGGERQLAYYRVEMKVKQKQPKGFWKTEKYYVKPEEVEVFYGS